MSDLTHYSKLKPHTTDKLRQALMQLIMTQPFWGTLALHMDFVPDESIPTMCTDGKRIYYNTKFTESLTTAKTIFAIAHECGHPMLHHLNRRYNRPPGDTTHYGCDENGKPFGVEPMVWNVAGDRFINRMLKDSGFSLWDKCVLGPANDRDKTTEEIYRELMKDQPPPPQPGGGQGQGQSSGQGQGQDQSQGGASQDDPSDTDEDTDEDIHGSDGGTDKDEDSSSTGAGDGDDDTSDGTNPDGIPGHESNSQRTGRKPGGPGCEDTQGNMDAGGDMRAPAEDVAEQDWNEIVVKAAAIAKAQGHLPASIEGIITEATEPQYPFYLILEQFLDECTKGDDFSWHKPHRDYFSRGIIMPGPYDESISHVVIAFDTSGSVPDEDLTRFARITGDIMRRIKPKRLTLIMCDAAIEDDSVLEVHDFRDWPREIKTTGRGGTSFKPVFEWVQENRIKPSCLVYMTDMYGSFPTDLITYPVLWASTTKDEEGTPGRTVYINQ
jgi:predicted metal-dependent peptidase